MRAFPGLKSWATFGRPCGTPRTLWCELSQDCRPGLPAFVPPGIPKHFGARAFPGLSPWATSVRPCGTPGTFWCELSQDCRPGLLAFVPAGLPEHFGASFPRTEVLGYQRAVPAGHVGGILVRAFPGLASWATSVRPCGTRLSSVQADSTKFGSGMRDQTQSVMSSTYNPRA